MVGTMNGLTMVRLVWFVVSVTIAPTETSEPVPEVVEEPLAQLQINAAPRPAIAVNRLTIYERITKRPPPRNSLGSDFSARAAPSSSEPADHAAAWKAPARSSTSTTCAKWALPAAMTKAWNTSW